MTRAGRAWTLATFAALFVAGPVLPLLVGRAERLRQGTPADDAPRRELPPDPLVEVIVPAYLESSTIGPSVERLVQDLTKAGLRHRVHVVASDEATALAAAGASQVTSAGRNGKPAAINLGVAGSEADVIVLTDANCEIQPADWPGILLAELADADLVSGNKTERASTEALFWRFESWVKGRRHGRSSTLAVVGEFLAFRREQFRPVPPATMTDDLWLALDFNARGLRVVTSASISTSEEPVSPADQWERRVRIAEGVLTEALPRTWELAQTAVGRHYLAHKVYRMTAGVTAFWVTTASLAGWRPRSTAPLVVLPVTAAIAQYCGVLRVRTPLDPVSALVAMQAVPVAAALRLLRRRLGHGVGPAVGWRKVAR
jgi:cellulose synthase/poly-beta-1,6-N-acetylglucosamine synthase-like glycosyltransferase